MSSRSLVTLLALMALWTAVPVQAQTPAPAATPPGPWTGTVSGGLALTNGNNDTIAGLITGNFSSFVPHFFR